MSPLIISPPMASVRFGMLVTGLAGKVGGQIVQRGRAGFQLRNNTKPRGSVESSSNAAKLSMQVVAGAWRGLSLANAVSWRDLAATLTRLDRFGNAYTPSGRQIFFEANLNLRSIGITSPLSSAPVQLALPVLENFAVTADHSPSDVELTWDYTSGASSWLVQPFYFGCSNTAKTFSGVSPIAIGTPADITTESIDITAPVAQRYPLTKTAGLLLSTGYRLVNNTTGQAGPILQLFTVYT